MPRAPKAVCQTRDRTSEVILVSVLPVAPRLLTVAEYLALGEPESGYTASWSRGAW